MLLVLKGQSNTLSCTAPCINGSGVKNVYFVRPHDDQDQENLNILNDPAIKPLLSEVNSTSNGETCSYSLEISWTQDKAIRMELDSLYCVLIYDSMYVKRCRTAVIPIRFTDTGNYKCSVMQYSSVHVYCC